MARDIEKLSAEKLPKSGEILERAKKVLLSPQATGPFRAPTSVAFMKEGRGSKIVDFDGNEYVDVTMAYGPLILGHSHPVVVEAAERAIRTGTVYAIAHEKEVRLAELMVDAIPCAERVAFVNTGTEATMRELLGTGFDGYKILFLQGGAQLQFAMAPMNLLRGSGKKADYVLTGSWGKKAIKEAKTQGEVRVAWDGQSTNYSRTPQPSELDLDPNAEGFHMREGEMLVSAVYELSTGRVRILEKHQ